MTQPSAIKATYADYRRIKGRKVLQVILEVPLEQAQMVHKYLGEPSCSDKEIWVGVALLQMDSPQEQQPDGGSVIPCTPTDHRLSRQSAWLCEQPLFWKYITERYVPSMEINNTAEAIIYVRGHCEVNSRAEFDTDPEAAKRWRDLHADYVVWKRGDVA